MDKWDKLRKHFVKQATELDEDDDYAIFALEVLDLMDQLEAEPEDMEGVKNEYD